MGAPKNNAHVAEKLGSGLQIRSDEIAKFSVRSKFRSVDRITEITVV